MAEGVEGLASQTTGTRIVEILTGRPHYGYERTQRGSMIEWWVVGIVTTLYGAGFIHGMTFAFWRHRQMARARAYRKAREDR